MKLVIKNYSRTPFFLLTWILIGSLFGSMVHNKEDVAFRLLVAILGLIVLNGLFALAIGYLESNER